MNKFKIMILRLLIILLLSAISANLVLAQKQPIDTFAINNWSSLGDYNISANGRFIFYYVNNRNGKDNYLVLRSVNNDSHFVFRNVINPMFSFDSEYFIFTNKGDSLIKYSLSQFKSSYVGSAKSYSISKFMNRDFIVYYSKENSNLLSIQDLTSDLKFKYENVESFIDKENSANMIIVQTNNSDGYHEVSLLRRSDLSLRHIWCGKGFKNIISNYNSSKLAMLKLEGKFSSIFIIDAPNYNFQHLLSDSSNNFSGLHISDIVNFSEDNERLRFIIKENDPINLPPADKIVNIYSYNIKRMGLHSNPSISNSFHAVFNLMNRSLFFGKEYETDILRFEAGEHVLISKINQLSGDKYVLNTFLYSEKNGAIVELFNNQALCNISPYGNYVVFFDFNIKSYISYDIINKCYESITERGGTEWLDKRDDHPKSDHNVLQPIAWFSDRRSFLLSDNFDIWRIYLDGTKKPICITGGVGRKQHLRFSLTGLNSNIITTEDSLLVSAFDDISKISGFYKVCVNSQCCPYRLSMSPSTFKNLKQSSDGSCFVLTMESENKSPNLFYTEDFISYKPISFIEPERKYNWLSTELIKYDSGDVGVLQGILYKPENFDSTKKYPVIINYYERVSDLLHTFSEPDFSYAEINIPFFVSNGYLVFTPDIHYKTGFPGRSAFNCVMGGVRQLVQLNYVDTNSIGIQGHSFGGFETNYIITHTDKFAAAMSASGPSNLISDYGSVFGSGDNRHALYEDGQVRMGTSIFQNLQLYIENSPVLYADKVTTPLLLMMNKDDGAVPFSQGVEFFTALQGLGKKVWMLNYFKENHFITDSGAAIDYTNRLLQFFDHYLKGKPIPEWMK